jgi:hypothetical protein
MGPGSASTKLLPDVDNTGSTQRASIIGLELKIG